MPSLLCLVVDHAPYGRIEPAEAIRHAGGALGKGWDVVLAFLGDSVRTALPGEWLSLSEALVKLIGDGKERVRVLADAASLGACRLSPTDLVPGVRQASAEDLARAMVECDRALLF